ncbi:MAG: glycosyltransferase [Candidatus Thorarchaeota archaeon]
MTQRINFELRAQDHVLNWNEAPSWNSEAATYFAKTKSDMSCALVHLLPADLLRCVYRDKNKAIGLTAFETTKIPDWIAGGYNENYKALIVPSDYNKRALERSGVTIPVRVVPHAIGDWWQKDYAPLPEKDDTYVFGFAGFWNSRKNPMTLLKAYVEAFPEPSNNQSLLLKTFQAGDVEGYVQSLCGQARPDIWIYNEEWTEDQMLWGFRLMDCYVSAHKGEAFGLTLAQAAALGKPTAYTNFSAPTEWLGPDAHYPIPYDLVSVGAEDLKPGYDHLEVASLDWADVSFHDLVTQLRQLAETKPRGGFRGEALSDFRKHMQWSSVGKALVDAVEDVMDCKLQRLSSTEESQ